MSARILGSGAAMSNESESSARPLPEEPAREDVAERDVVPGGEANAATGDITPMVEEPLGEHPHTHGRPRSWVLVAVVTAAFCVGGAAIIEHLWILFWVCAGIVAASVPVGKLIGIMDDTVESYGWVDDRPPAADRGTAADPGVRIR